MSDSFVHLHTHTEYSVLDGAAKIAPLFEEVKRLGMSAVSMTDHGNMFGSSEFYRLAKQYEIKPIIGIEAYIAPESRFNKNRIFWGSPEQKRDDVSGSGSYSHMTMLAENDKGLKNLFRLSSLASYEGQLGKWPRMDLELIANHSEGIIATTGCPSGEVQTRLRLGQFDEALAAAAKWQEIFGPENYYLELMEHGLDIEKRVREDLLKIGKLLDLPPLATNDSHYVTKADAANHEALLCVQTGKTLTDPTRFKLDGEGYFIKSPQEMRALWDKEIPEACDNTLLIAERVQSYDKVWEFHNRMPVFPVPEGYTQETWLKQEAFEGLKKRLKGEIPPEYKERLEYELKVIIEMGFPAYFLVVADLIRHANSVGIKVGPGRGSAAGSLVAYALRIINTNPIEHGLYFERFLNPERVSMPDIDIDFDDRRRGEMVRYAMERWGDEYVAQVITFGKIKTKAAIKDAARVSFGQPGYNIADKISKALPPAIMAKDISLAGIFDPEDERYKEASQVRELIETEPECKQIYDTALGLDGLTRNIGVHACAVILSSEPLLDVIPLWKRPVDEAIITGWDYPSCESIGLLKMDFLGLRNLTVIGDALENIKKNKGIDLDLDEIPLDNMQAYNLLSKGDTLGVFQLDSGPIRDLLRRMQPTSFNDIVATIALYRPGPMAMNAHNDYADRKNKRQKIKPIHPELEEPLKDILAETYGLIVYQEQIMAIAQKVAGYSLGRADILRRAMGKKKAAVLEAEFEGFSAGMEANGFSKAAITALWEAILPFAGYAFNKSHAAGYGLVSYWTAYLKANYPSEYMAGLLTSVADDKDKSALYLADCRHLGITVLPPDINHSDKKFTTVGEDINFALSAIRNVGSAVVDSIIATRKEKGDYVDFYDFLQKSTAQVCTKKVIESLIKAGAFDTLQHPRKGLFLAYSEVLDAIMGTKKAEEIGQFDLFGQAEDLAEDFSGIFNVNIPQVEWDKKELLALERQMIGLYVSDHPLNGVAEIIAAQCDTSIPTVIAGDVKDGSSVTVGGILTSVTRKVNKNGAPYAVVQLEDLSGGVEVYFFPKAYQVYADEIIQDNLVIISARVNVRDDKVVLIANNIGAPDLSKKITNGEEKVILKVEAKLCTNKNIENLKNILTKNPGKSPVELRLVEDGVETTLQIAENFTVSKNVEFASEVKALFGLKSIVNQ